MLQSIKKIYKKNQVEMGCADKCIRQNSSKFVHHNISSAWFMTNLTAVLLKPNSNIKKAFKIRLWSAKENTEIPIESVRFSLEESKN